MRIGIIGAGTAARAFASKAIPAGYEVQLSNSRGAETLDSVVNALGAGATAAERHMAASNPIVLLAVPWMAVEAALSGLPGWSDRILIDATNGIGPEGLVDFGDDTSSERVAALAPGARVVKAMNSLFMSNFAKAPTGGGMRRALFVSSDDAAAKTTVADLFERLGFAPVDLGGLREGGRIQGVGCTLAGHDLHLPWPAPRSFPAFSGAGLTSA